ncbi:MAG: helix-turn-helix domain-containing protein [Polyangiaceae bacterium]|nr:helix-turn-helix domain-containing protein [Polyangiaceae bacterium]
MNTTPTAPTPAFKFSKAKVIASRLGVRTRTVFRWAEQGRITRHKVNAWLVLFNEAEVEALIESTRIR